MTVAITHLEQGLARVRSRPLCNALAGFAARLLAKGDSMAACEILEELETPLAKVALLEQLMGQAAIGHATWVSGLVDLYRLEHPGSAVELLQRGERAMFERVGDEHALQWTRLRAEAVARGEFLPNPPILPNGSPRQQAAARRRHAREIERLFRQGLWRFQRAVDEGPVFEVANFYCNTTTGAAPDAPHERLLEFDLVGSSHRDPSRGRKRFRLVYQCDHWVVWQGGHVHASGRQASRMRPNPLWHLLARSYLVIGGTKWRPLPRLRLPKSVITPSASLLHAPARHNTP